MIEIEFEMLPVQQYIGTSKIIKRIFDRRLLFCKWKSRFETDIVEIIVDVIRGVKSAFATALCLC